MSFLEKLKKGVGIEEEISNQEGFEGEEDKSLLPPPELPKEAKGRDETLVSSNFATAREVKETSSLLPPRSAREVEEMEKPTQPKKRTRKTPQESPRLSAGQAKKIKAKEKFVELREEIPKKAPGEIKTEEGSTATALLPPKEKKWPEPEGQLAVDVYQTDGELVIQSAIAGIKPDDLDITIQEDKVIIRGKRERTGAEEKNYFYQECYWGPFSREIILPVEVDTSRAEASMMEGILTIKMPKIEREKRKKIIVK